jgi:hypothetical protein
VTFSAQKPPQGCHPTPQPPQLPTLDNPIIRGKKCDDLQILSLTYCIQAQIL